MLILKSKDDALSLSLPQIKKSVIMGLKVKYKLQDILIYYVNVFIQETSLFMLEYFVLWVEWGIY